MNTLWIFIVITMGQVIILVIQLSECPLTDLLGRAHIIYVYIFDILNVCTMTRDLIKKLMMFQSFVIFLNPLTSLHEQFAKHACILK